MVVQREIGAVPYSVTVSGGNVVVTGIAYEGLTGWYIRDVAMTIDSIREITN